MVYLNHNFFWIIDKLTWILINKQALFHYVLVVFLISLRYLSRYKGNSTS